MLAGTSEFRARTKIRLASFLAVHSIHPRVVSSSSRPLPLRAFSIRFALVRDRIFASAWNFPAAWSPRGYEAENERAQRVEDRKKAIARHGDRPMRDRWMLKALFHPVNRSVFRAGEYEIPWYHGSSGASLRVSVQRVFAALASSALALANWFRARRVRVREITGASWGRRAHRGRGRGEKALQARLMQEQKTGELNARSAVRAIVENKIRSVCSADSKISASSTHTRQMLF